MATTDTTLDDNAAKPSSFKNATGEVQQHKLLDQVEYEKYKAGKAARAASSSPLVGMKITRAGFGSPAGNT